MLEQIDLSYGAGGKKFDELLNGLFYEVFRNDHLLQGGDGALLGEISGKIVMATDSHVVSPLFFPGGDIGKLAFCGTVNDLAMMGATPLYLSIGMIIEEGFSFEALKKIVESIGQLSKKYNIPIVTGDTKVVERGRCDGIYINTTGIGQIESPDIDLGAQSIKEGHCVIVSGNIGEHEIAILGAREGVDFATNVLSDCYPLHEVSNALVSKFPDISCMRDPTRGGMAALLNELSKASNISIEIEQQSIPLSEGVRATCELVGLDFLSLACEGRFVLFAPVDQGEEIINFLRKFSETSEAAIIGKTYKSDNPIVSLKTNLGAKRVVMWPVGQSLPRIC